MVILIMMMMNLLFGHLEKDEIVLMKIAVVEVLIDVSLQNIKLSLFASFLLKNSIQQTTTKIRFKGFNIYRQKSSGKKWWSFFTRRLDVQKVINELLLYKK